MLVTKICRRVLCIVACFAVLSATPSPSWASKRKETPKDPGVLVFVPGTLNWLVPGSFGGDGGASFSPYYSKAILETAREKGYDVYVIRNLRALGDFEENGKSLYAELREWYLKKYPKKDVPITLLGHSAGGFYSLTAATLLPSLPIQKIILIATALNGTEVADAVFDHLLQKKGDSVIEKMGDWMDVRGLLQLTTRHVERFLSRLRLSSRIQLYTVGGAQPKPRTVADWTDFNYLCPVCELAANYLPDDEESDGVITTSSAFGTKAFIQNKSGSEHPIHRLWDLKPNLDHVEQLLDSRLYLATGILNTEELEKEQIRFYSALLDAVWN